MMTVSSPMLNSMPTFSMAHTNLGGLMSRLAPTQSSVYPIDSFPGLLGMVARKLSTSGAVSPEIVGTVLMAIASLLTQGIADTAWPNGQPISIGANGLVVSPSGSGKSIIYKQLLQVVEKYLASRMAENPDEHCDLLVEDATREALVRSLSELPVAGLLTDEAEILERLLKAASTLVKLLDGSPLRSARISTGRVAIPAPRLSILMMEQPKVFEETKRLLGACKGGVGLINRFFVAVSRDFHASNSPHSVRLSGEVAQAYEIRAQDLLDELFEHIKQGNPERPTVMLGAEASQCLLDIGHDARQKCMPNSPLFFISEYIQRHAERVLRLAGVFHVFEHGVGGEISLDTLLRAESLGEWYINSFARIFYEPPKLTLAETDADKIAQKILDPCLMRGMSGCSQADLRTEAFNLGLTSTRFNRALAVLCEQGRVRVIQQRNKLWVLFDLAYSPSNW